MESWKNTQSFFTNSRVINKIKVKVMSWSMKIAMMLTILLLFTSPKTLFAEEKIKPTVRDFSYLLYKHLEIAFPLNLFYWENKHYLRIRW